MRRLGDEVVDGMLVKQEEAVCIYSNGMKGIYVIEIESHPSACLVGAARGKSGDGLVKAKVGGSTKGKSKRGVSHMQVSKPLPSTNGMSKRDVSHRQVSENVYPRDWRYLRPSFKASSGGRSPLFIMSKPVI